MAGWRAPGSRGPGWSRQSCFEQPYGVKSRTAPFRRKEERSSWRFGRGSGSANADDRTRRGGASRVVERNSGQYSGMARRTGVALGTTFALAAIAAPGASAGPRVDYKQTFTTAIPGRPAGTDTRLLYKNPNDPKAKPIPVRREEFTFPAGATYDESVVPDCTASDEEIR